MNRLTIFIAAGVISLTTACVPKRHLTEAQAANANLTKLNRELNEDVNSLRSRLGLMEAANEDAEMTIDEKEKALAEKERLMREKEERISMQQSKIEQLQDVLDRQKRNTELLRNKMAQALGNFSSDQLTVTTKNGKVYVSLSEKLLFASGSAEVSAEGKTALSKVAEALKDNKEINVNIEGHTDSIPIKGRFQDNWALSVARSTAIVRLLTHTYGVEPTRITASGRSEYEPVASNSTSEGRAKNRRTEIILAPKLDELMQLISD